MGGFGTICRVPGGARSVEQVSQNVASAALPPLREDQQQGVRDVYDRLIRPHVHDRW